MKKKDKYVLRITDGCYVIADEVANVEWKQVCVMFYTKRSKDGLLVDDIKIYENGIKIKKWWQFWK